MSGEVVAVMPSKERGGGSTPFTRSRIRVTGVGKGDVAVGDIVVVEQTGGVYRATHLVEDQKRGAAPLRPDAPGGARPMPPASVEPVVFLEFEDDPLFCVGERVALALEWNRRLRVYQLEAGPQGRFEVDTRGNVRPMVRQDPAVSRLDGLSLRELLARVAAVETP